MQVTKEMIDAAQSVAPNLNPEHVREILQAALDADANLKAMEVIYFEPNGKNNTYTPSQLPYSR